MYEKADQFLNLKLALCVYLCRVGRSLLYFLHNCSTSTSWTWVYLSVHATWRSRSRAKTANETRWVDFSEEKIGGPTKNFIKFIFLSLLDTKIESCFTATNQICLFGLAWVFLSVLKRRAEHFGVLASKNKTTAFVVQHFYLALLIERDCNAFVLITAASHFTFHISALIYIKTENKL